MFTLPSLLSCPLFSVEEDKLVQFVVFGTPVPKARGRAVHNKNGSIRIVNASKRSELWFSNTVKSIMGGLIDPQSTYFHQDFLEISIFFEFQRPPSHYKGNNRASNLLKEDALLLPTQSDIDNLAKFVLDSLNGVLYKDDSRVVALFVSKIWSRDSKSPGSTTVRIRSVANAYTLVPNV